MISVLVDTVNSFPWVDCRRVLGWVRERCQQFGVPDPTGERRTTAVADNRSKE